MYNLLLLSGFDIIERHKHTFPVSYVPLGLDATVFYGKKNLKMKNPYYQSFEIKVEQNSDYISISLIGDTRLEFEYDVETEIEEHDLNIQEEGRTYNKANSIYIYRNKWYKDKLIEKKFLYKDYLPATYTSK
jgi:vancomycin resistance protein YoaR